MAALLLSGFLVTWGALAAIGMLVTFMIVVGSAMVRGLNLSCSCFGILYRERVGWPTQIRDSVLLAMAVYVIWQSDRVLTIGQLVSNPTPLVHAAELGLTVVAIGFSISIAILSLSRQHKGPHGHISSHATPG